MFYTYCLYCQALVQVPGQDLERDLEGELDGELEGDSKGDSKGDFRGDFKQDIEGDLLSISGQVRSRSGSANSSNLILLR